MTIGYIKKTRVAMTDLASTYVEELKIIGSQSGSSVTMLSELH
jgi:hypothetical protein